MRTNIKNLSSQNLDVVFECRNLLLVFWLCILAE